MGGDGVAVVVLVICVGATGLGAMSKGPRTCLLESNDRRESSIFGLRFSQYSNSWREGGGGEVGRGAMNSLPRPGRVLRSVYMAIDIHRLIYNHVLLHSMTLDSI